MKEQAMTHLPQSESLLARLEPLQRYALRIGIVAGILLLLAGAFLGSTQFFRSYLVSIIFWVQISLGALVILMIHHVIGGRWGVMIQRLLEAASLTLPLMALLFVILFLGIPVLYPWANPDFVAHHYATQVKQIYLNTPFFIIRTLVFFAIWILFAHLLRKWSIKLDSDPENKDLRDRLRNLSAPGVVVFGFTITFASVDWMMSLEPDWYSTIYGMRFGVATFVAAFALVDALLMKFLAYEPWRNRIKTLQISDLGNWLLAGVMLWAYLAFSQFLIIWSGNLAEEIPWYVARTAGGWQWVALVLVVLHFTLPFFFLLSRGTKQAPNRLFWVAAIILVVRFVDVIWRIVPAFHPEQLYIHWMDVLALIAVGGFWVAFFLRHLTRAPMLPLYDSRAAAPAQQEVVGHAR